MSIQGAWGYIRERLAGWSLVHFLFNAAITLAISIVVGSVAKMSTAAVVGLAGSIFVAIASGMALWRMRQREPATESVAGLCKELALEVEGIVEQGKALDWAYDVEAMLYAANFGWTSHDLFKIMAPLAQREASEALIESRLRRAAIWLRALGPRLERMEPLLTQHIGQTSYTAVRELLKKTADEASSIGSMDDARKWARRALIVLSGAGQQVHEFRAIVTPLSDGDEQADFVEILGDAAEWLRVREAMIAPDREKEPMQELSD